MAELVCSSIATVMEKLKQFEEKIEHERIEIKKEYFAAINPLLSEFKRSQHTEDETNEFIRTIDDVLTVLKEKDSAINEIIRTLTEEKSLALQRCYGIRKSMYREEPTGEGRNRTSKKDSGYHSTDSRVLAETDSHDARVFTEEGHLVTRPVQDRTAESDDKQNLEHVGDTTC